MGCELTRRRPPPPPPLSKVRLSIEPFYTVLRLRNGLAKIYSRFPFLLSTELSDPGYLGQAACDEKDDRVTDTVEEFAEAMLDLEIGVGTEGEVVAVRENISPTQYGGRGGEGPLGPP